MLKSFWNAFKYVKMNPCLPEIVYLMIFSFLLAPQIKNILNTSGNKFLTYCCHGKYAEVICTYSLIT
jgi:hypothetical protein